MYKWILAWRYFRKRPITLLAVAAVALCVFIVVVVMTVMNGLVGEFREKNHLYVGDCVISSDSLVGFGYYEPFVDQLIGQPFVEAVSPVVRQVGLLTQPGQTWNMGVEIVGVDPRFHARATGFGDSLHFRSDTPDLAFVPLYDSSLEGCVVGIDKIVRRSPDGDYLHDPEPYPFTLILSSFPLNTRGLPTRVGTDMVSSRTFYYSDNSHSGLVKVDANVVYIPLDRAQTLCGMDSPLRRVNEISISFRPGVSLAHGVAQVQTLWHAHVAAHRDQPGGDLFDYVAVESWQQNRRAFIAPMEKEQTMLILLFLMLGIITVFIVFVVLYMIVSHSGRDIGILRSIGAPTGGVVVVFEGFAILTGLVGAATGAGAGMLFLWRINAIEDWLHRTRGWQLWDRSVYAIGDIPNQIDPVLIASVFGAAIIACIIGGLVPSLKAGLKRPVETLQVSQL
ncbi:MAG: ABC transporter permease [Phycisphaerae bacterium]|nr:ABC transporter permease [Phycisphaerae bacterium]